MPVKVLERSKVTRFVEEDAVEDVQTLESLAFRNLVSIIPVKTNFKLK